MPLCERLDQPSIQRPPYGESLSRRLGNSYLPLRGRFLGGWGWSTNALFSKMRPKWSAESDPANCPICSSLFTTLKSGQTPCWDHCHRCQSFRGWLCRLCNWAEGQSRSRRPHFSIRSRLRNPDWQNRLKTYLEAHVCPLQPRSSQQADPREALQAPNSLKAANGGPEGYPGIRNDFKACQRPSEALQAPSIVRCGEIGIDLGLISPATGFDSRPRFQKPPASRLSSRMRSYGPEREV